jgi:peroxiredoxin Q/BCP
MKYLKNSLLGIIMCLGMFGLKGLSQGNAAPQFELPDQDNKTRTLTEFKGKYIVLYFYPKDDTPGCTKQACQLRNHFDEFEKNDIVVLGINYDSPKSHKKFKEKHKLPFILLSDKKKAVAKKYGAKNWWFIPVPYRMTFVIDPEGNIVSIMESVDVGSHAEKVLDKVKILKDSTKK